MTQEEVLRVLKKKKRWMTTQEIGNILKTGSGSVSSTLRKLLKYKEIKFKKSRETFGGKPYLYKAK